MRAMEGIFNNLLQPIAPTKSRPTPHTPLSACVPVETLPLSIFKHVCGGGVRLMGRLTNKPMQSYVEYPTCVMHITGLGPNTRMESLKEIVCHFNFLLFGGGLFYFIC